MKSKNYLKYLCIYLPGITHDKQPNVSSLCTHFLTSWRKGSNKSLISHYCSSVLAVFSAEGCVCACAQQAPALGPHGTNTHTQDSLKYTCHVTSNPLRRNQSDPTHAWSVLTGDGCRGRTEPVCGRQASAPASPGLLLGRITVAQTDLPEN